jgi:8-oxo-dGTP pyrophosphatase MutT (NUDIX family)
MSEEDAGTALEALGLTLGERKEEKSEDVAKGMIISQDIAALTDTPQGTAVGYTVSTGKGKQYVAVINDDFPLKDMFGPSSGDIEITVRIVAIQQVNGKQVEKVLLELPAGCIEAGEDPKDGAARELLEETGYKAGSLEFLFKIAPNASNCTSYAQCYLARNVFPAAPQNLDETEALEVVELEGEEVKRLLREGGVEQAVHVAALYRAAELGALG